jgi:hypothetical protein
VPLTSDGRLTGAFEDAELEAHLAAVTAELAAEPAVAALPQAEPEGKIHRADPTFAI